MIIEYIKYFLSIYLSICYCKFISLNLGFVPIYQSSYLANRLTCCDIIQHLEIKIDVTTERDLLDTQRKHCYFFPFILPHFCLTLLLSLYLSICPSLPLSAMNCEAYSSFEGVSTEHRIVTAKIRLSLRKNTKRTATTKRYDWAHLNNTDIRDKYVLELRNRFETLQEKTEKSTPNDEYENFVTAHLEAAAKCIPTKLKTKYRVPWETLAVREKRALVKTASKNYRKTQQTQMP